MVITKEIAKNMYLRQILSNNTLYEVEEKDGELEYKLDKNDNKIEICKLEDVEFEEKNLLKISNTIKAGGTPSRDVYSYWTTLDDEDGIPWLDIDRKEFETFSIKNYREKITKHGFENSNTWIVPENSIMITIGGSLGYIAYNTFETTTNQNILNIILKDNYFYKYIIYVLNNYYEVNIRNNVEEYKNLSKSSEEKRIIKIPKDKQIFNEKEYPSFQIQQSIVKLFEERLKEIEKRKEYNNILIKIKETEREWYLKDVF